MLKGDSPALSGQNSELIGGKKNKIIFSNTAKTISSIEDKKTGVSRNDWGLVATGEQIILKKGKKRELNPMH